jgi:two-component system sensor histidine kinase MprB
MPLQKLNRLDVLSLQMVIDSERRDEVGRLSIAFHRMIGALARSRADQRRLVEDAGHELRTPVTSIRTGLDTLSRYPGLAS